MTRIALLSATNQNNLELAKKIEEVIKKKNHTESEIVQLEDLMLPLYTQPGEAKGIPAKAVELSQLLQRSDALIICAPEYNGGIPPVLNNAIAWVSRSGEDWRAAFNQKIAVVATHSGGGGAKALQVMKMQLEHLGAVVLPRTITTNGFTPFKEQSCEKIIDQLIQLARKN